MYKLKLISEVTGVDFGGPLHPTIEDARRATEVMFAIHQERLTVEIYKLDGFLAQRGTVVERFEKPARTPQVR